MHMQQTYSLLWHDFHDAKREGDSKRIMTYWKFVMVNSITF